MIIKTITCQKVNNHGATLQAYALMHYLESLGNDVEIIDYIPERFNHFRPFVCNTEKYANNIILKTAYICAKFPSRFVGYLKYKNSLRKTNFENFWNKYYHLTKCYKTFDELKNNPPEADLYIAGSDQIWNTMMENGKDPAYYLQFVKNGIRATYAASFSVSEIPDELKNQTKAFIESLIMVITADTTYCYQFWYLYLLVGLYILIPIIKPWVDKYMNSDKSTQESNIMFIFLMIVSLIIPTTLRIVGFEGTVWKGAFTVFTAFVFYLFTGTYLYRWDMPKGIKCFVGVTFVAQVIWFSYNMMHGQYESICTWFGYESFFTLEMSVILYSLAKKFYKPIKNSVGEKLVSVISKNSLGIYILYVMVLMLLSKMGFSSNIINIYVFPIINVSITIVICIIGSEIINRIPIIKKLI